MIFELEALAWNSKFARDFRVKGGCKMQPPGKYQLVLISIFLPSISAVFLKTSFKTPFLYDASIFF